MEEEKLMEDEAKKQKERNNEVGGQNFTPPTLFNSAKAESTQCQPPRPPKKKFKLQISWSKF